MSKTVLVSGGFDPLHVGHVRMVRDAEYFGKVIVVINSDEWLIRKKGYVFMPLNQRIEIVQGLKWVDAVYPMDSFIGSDDDDTVKSALEKIRPTFFANGGDRSSQNVPEQEICEKHGIQMLWGIGGTEKPQSSSWLVENAMKAILKKKDNDT